MRRFPQAGRTVRKLFDFDTTMMLLSALVICGVALVPSLHRYFLLYLPYRALFFGDTLFHEMGHAVFGWLFGYPSIPSILTVFGTDKASGVTLNLGLGHFWCVHALVYGCLATLCYKIHDQLPHLFWPATFLTVLLAIASLTPYTHLIITYMGHGSAMLCGGFLLWRGLLYVDARNNITRWLNTVFGLFIVLNNMLLCWNLVFDPIEREKYSSLAVGSMSNDFEAMTHLVPTWTVSGIAIFTLGLGGLILTGCLILGIYFEEMWDDYTG